MTRSIARPFALLAALALFASACAEATIPDPKDAVRAYADAAARGDADAIYAMMSEQSQRSLSRDEVARMVAEEREELAEQSKALAQPDLAIKAEARVRFADGETAALAIEDGAFRVTAAEALPAGAKTPAEALGELRRVLARRSYAGLIRVLSKDTRAAIESDLRSLVLGLENPEGLDIEVAGDTAVVSVPGGHQVKLTREAGVWRVHDFD